MADTVYSASEVAEVLRVTRATVINFIKRGQLSAFKCGNQWRITHKALLQFCVNQTLNKIEGEI